MLSVLPQWSYTLGFFYLKPMLKLRTDKKYDKITGLWRIEYPDGSMDYAEEVLSHQPTKTFNTTESDGRIAMYVVVEEYKVILRQDQISLNTYKRIIIS